MRFLLMALVFLQPINHVNALRLISLYLLLGLFCVSLLQKGRGFLAGLGTPATLALLALAGWAVIASVIGPYPLESLNAARKSLMPQILLFLVIISEFRSPDQIKNLFKVIVFSFVVTTALSAWEILRIGIGAFNVGMLNHGMFLGGYASNAGFYFPFTLLWLFTLAGNARALVKAIAIITLICSYFIILLYNSRTALIAVSLSALLIPLLTGRRRTILVIVPLLLFIAAVTLFTGGELAKYKSLGNPETYVTNTGLSIRLSIWRGVGGIVRERLITGYGYGWKKLAWVVNNNGWLARWKNNPDPNILAYYAPQGAAGYGRVNPHSLLLQILFELGLVGLALYASFWLSALKSIAARIHDRTRAPDLFMRGSLGVILPFFLLNVTNGYWEGTLANMILVFLACILALLRADAGN
ncbi:MAG: O-antigen ligase family protein [Sulfuricella sp.]|nr:O-antigen ligase family protein [Sulfuricella sp.]